MEKDNSIADEQEQEIEVPEEETEEPEVKTEDPELETEVPGEEPIEPEVKTEELETEIEVPEEETIEPEIKTEDPEPEIAVPEEENKEPVMETEDPEPAIDDPEDEKAEDEELTNAEETLPEELEAFVDDSDLQKMVAEAELDLMSPIEDKSVESVGEVLCADQSSSPSEIGPNLNKEKRLSKHKNKAKEGSVDSVCSLTLEEAVLPDLEPKTPPPMSPKETQTDWRNCGVEIINLPLLKEMKKAESETEEKGKKWDERVLGTGITAHFKGPMPTVVLPLDRFYPMDSPRLSTCGRISPRGSTLEVISTYTTRTANNVVDAQVTYRDGKQSGIRVDIDGGGLQVVLDVAQKKKKRKINRWERRVKREPLSLRPPKPKPNRCPDLRRKLSWLEDKSEDRHIQRMELGREAKEWKPSLAKIDPPDFGPRWKDWHAMPYSDESPTKNVGRTHQSTNQHVGLMMFARLLDSEKKQPRQLAPQPQSLPPATDLYPSAKPASVYEDEKTKRLREAREHYAKVSVGKLPPRPLEGIKEERGSTVFEEYDSDDLENFVISDDSDLEADEDGVEVNTVEVGGEVKVEEEEDQVENEVEKEEEEKVEADDEGEKVEEEKVETEAEEEERVENEATEAEEEEKIEQVEDDIAEEQEVKEEEREEERVEEEVGEEEQSEVTQEAESEKVDDDEEKEQPEGEPIVGQEEQEEAVVKEEQEKEEEEEK